MHRLLIVDDEPIVVEGIFQLFKENSEFDIDICKAFSGVEALEILKSTKIDVVLTDIRMPGLNGLQLLEEICKYWPTCKVIFLTGYSEFDYAYTAIHKPGVNYILKTEGDEVIFKAVEEALTEIKREEAQREFIDNAREQLNSVLSTLRKEFFLSLLEGDKISNDNIQKRFKEFEVQLKLDEPVYMAACKLDSTSYNISNMEKAQTLCTINDIFEKQLRDFIVNIEVVYENSIQVWIMQPNLNKGVFIGEKGAIKWKEFITFVKANIESIQNTIKEHTQKSVSFIVSSKPVEWEEIYSEITTFKLLIDKISVIGYEMMIIDDDIDNDILKLEWRNKVIDYMDFSKNLKLLETYMDQGLEEKFEVAFNDLFYKIKQSNQSSHFFKMEMLFSLQVLFLSYINRQDLSNEVFKDINLDFMITISENRNWNDSFDYYFKLGEVICKLKSSQKENGNELVISKIHKYIDDNLHKDLSLVKIAEAVYFNSSYLSRFYKQVTGRNLSDYITEVKYERAKRLLGNLNIRINEVAHSVGFESPSYFTLFFKKLSGLTPQEFRDSVNNE